MNHNELNSVLSRFRQRIDYNYQQGGHDYHGTSIIDEILTTVESGVDGVVLRLLRDTAPYHLNDIPHDVMVEIMRYLSFDDIQHIHQLYHQFREDSDAMEVFTRKFVDVITSISIEAGSMVVLLHYIMKYELTTDHENDMSDMEFAHPFFFNFYKEFIDAMGHNNIVEYDDNGYFVVDTYAINHILQHESYGDFEYDSSGMKGAPVMHYYLSYWTSSGKTGHHISPELMVLTAAHTGDVALMERIACVYDVDVDTVCDAYENTPLNIMAMYGYEEAVDMARLTGFKDDRRTVVVKRNGFGDHPAISLIVNTPKRNIHSVLSRLAGTTQGIHFVNGDSTFLMHAVAELIRKRSVSEDILKLLWSITTPMTTGNRGVILILTSLWRAGYKKEAHAVSTWVSDGVLFTRDMITSLITVHATELLDNAFSVPSDGHWFSSQDCPYKMTSIMIMAIAYGDDDLVANVIDSNRFRKEVNVLSNKKRTALKNFKMMCLELAAASGNVRTMDILVSKNYLEADSNDRALLHTAFRYEHIAMTSYLYQKNIDLKKIVNEKSFECKQHLYFPDIWGTKLYVVHGKCIEILRTSNFAAPNDTQYVRSKDCVLDELRNQIELSDGTDDYEMFVLQRVTAVVEHMYNMPENLVKYLPILYLYELYRNSDHSFELYTEHNKWRLVEHTDYFFLNEYYDFVKYVRSTHIISYEQKSISSSVKKALAAIGIPSFASENIKDFIGTSLTKPYRPIWFLARYWYRYISSPHAPPLSTIMLFAAYSMDVNVCGGINHIYTHNLSKKSKLFNVALDFTYRFSPTDSYGNRPSAIMHLLGSKERSNEIGKYRWNNNGIIKPLRSNEVCSLYMQHSNPDWHPWCMEKPPLLIHKASDFNGILTKKRKECDNISQYLHFALLLKAGGVVSLSMQPYLVQQKLKNSLESNVPQFLFDDRDGWYCMWIYMDALSNVTTDRGDAALHLFRAIMKRMSVPFWWLHYHKMGHNNSTALMWLNITTDILSHIGDSREVYRDAVGIVVAHNNIRTMSILYEWFKDQKIETDTRLLYSSLRTLAYEIDSIELVQLLEDVNMRSFRHAMITGNPRIFAFMLWELRSEITQAVYEELTGYLDQRGNESDNDVQMGWFDAMQSSLQEFWDPK